MTRSVIREVTVTAVAAAGALGDEEINHLQMMVTQLRTRPELRDPLQHNSKDKISTSWTALPMSTRKNRSWNTCRRSSK